MGLLSSIYGAVTGGGVGSVVDAADQLLPLAGSAVTAEMIRDVGKDMNREAQALGQQLNEGSQFRVFGSTVPQDLMGGAQNAFGSAMGTAESGTYNPLLAQAQASTQTGQGMMTDAGLGLAGQQANSLAASQQAMQNAMMGTAGREQEIYNRAMAMQQPGLDRARAAQQAREYAQGRGGIRGSQFGGTAEDAAMARAQAEAMNAASFQAMGQAQQEMMNQGTLAGQFGQMGLGASGQLGQLGQGYGQLGNQLGQLGAQQQNSALQAASTMGQLGQAQGQLGLNVADLIQTGQLTGQGYLAQLGLGGIQSELEGALGAGSTYASMFDALMRA